MAKQYALSDQEIIQFYENGLSQNDIHRKYDVSLKHIRAVLKAAGFQTAGYRRIPSEQEKVIRALLHAGIPYRAVGVATDMSYHVIRDIAERLPGRTERRSYHKRNHRMKDRESEFLSRFLDGESFCNISVDMHLDNKEIIRCYSYLDNVALSRHSDALHRRLNAEDMDLNTKSSLARKHGISASVVKAHLNN